MDNGRTICDFHIKCRTAIMMSGKIFTVENVSLKTMPLVKHSAHTVAHSTPFYDAAVDKEPVFNRIHTRDLTASVTPL